MENKSGTVLRGYELQKLLGEGGFGAVYRAHQPAVKRDVALKVILPDYANQPEFIRSFESEAQLVARLEHLHIVPLYDFWRDPDGAYLVMRLMRGGSLRDLIEQGPLELNLAARILDQISSALHTAHRQGIIHRDIKPDNILLDEEKNAFLTDFGISLDLNRQIEDDEDFDDSLTGSPHYISPEQAQQQRVSPRSDVYSLGIVLFEMLTGQAPFAGNTTMMELILKQINEPLPPIETLNPDLPPDVDLVIQRATDKNPEARYSDTLALALAFRQSVPSLAGGTVSVATAEKVKVAPDAVVDLITPSIDNPYKGLRPFEQADSEDFFGRDELIKRLLEAAEKSRFLAVIGPSGSGKSSVVKAGLIPRLRSGALTGSDHWFFAEMVPSNDPFRELASTLLGCATKRMPNLENQLRVSDRGLLEAVNNLLPDDDTQLLLLIDQFEETFTQVADEALRAAFLANLMVAATSADSRVRIIVTLRADFYDRPLLYPGFGELIRRHGEVVLPLGPAEIEQAIVGPAARADLIVEPGLIAAITAEIQDQPGALPLLQYALTEVFERRKGSTLTYDAYHASGGVLGALARRAEEIYVQLDTLKQNAARQIFLRLVTLGEGTEDTRRRIEQGELLSLEDNSAATQAVLDLYSRYRLLTYDHDPVTRNPTVEVAHEAIIREWTRLREWLDESRDDVRAQQRLAAAAGVWISERRDTSFLADGLRLQQFELLLNSGNISLTEDEKAYVTASVAERERRAAAEAERIAREQALEKRNRRILQTATSVFAVLTVIAIIATIFALSQRGEAVTARDEAESARDEAETNFERAESEAIQRATAQAEAIVERNNAQRQDSRSLAVISRGQLVVDPVASINLALRAIRDGDTSSENYVPEAELALTDAVNQSQERIYAEPFGTGTISDSAISGDQVAFVGTGLAISDIELQTITPLEEIAVGTTTQPIVNWSSSGQLLSVRGTQLVVWEDSEAVTSLETEEPIRCAEWHPDGTLIGVCAGSQVIIWQPSDNTRISIANPDTATDFNQIFEAVSWTPDGRYVVMHNTVRILVWDQDVQAVIYEIVRSDLATNDEALTHLHPDNFDITMLDDARFLSWGDGGRILLWSVADGAFLQDLSFNPVGVNGIAISPDSDRLLIHQNEGIETIWMITPDGLTNQGELSLDTGGAISSAAWRDDRYLALSPVNSSNIIIWDTHTNQAVSTLYGHRNRVEQLAWLSDGRRLLSISQDGSARVWEVFRENGQPLGQGKLYEAEIPGVGYLTNTFWVDDNTIALDRQDGLAHRIDLNTQTITTLPNDDSRTRWFITWSDDGSQVIRYEERSQKLQLWDIDTQTMRFEISTAARSAFWTPVGIFYSSTTGELTWLDFDGNVLATLEDHSGGNSTAVVNDLVYHAATRQVAAAADDAFINVYTLPTTTPVTTPILPDHTLDTGERISVRLTWHSDGQRLVSIGFNGDVFLWDVDTEDAIFFATTGEGDFPGRAIAFSPDEEYMAAAIDDELIVLNLEGDIILRATATNAVQGAGWVPHESRLRVMTWGFTNETNGFIEIWDVDPTGDGDRLVWRTEAVGYTLFAVANSDGTQLLAGGRSGRVSVFQIWPDVPTLIDEAVACCQTRPLSEAQQDEFNIRE